MINYSIYDPDFVFADWENFQPEYKTMELSNGIKLEVEKVNDQDLKIIQVRSTNPQDYLRSELTPGNLLKSKLQLQL